MLRHTKKQKLKLANIYIYIYKSTNTDYATGVRLGYSFSFHRSQLKEVAFNRLSPCEGLLYETHYCRPYRFVLYVL